MCHCLGQFGFCFTLYRLSLGFALLCTWNGVNMQLDVMLIPHYQIFNCTQMSLLIYFKKHVNFFITSCFSDYNHSASTDVVFWFLITILVLLHAAYLCKFEIKKSNLNEFAVSYAKG